MTDEEFMKQVELEWSRIDDDPDMFDELSFFEELDSDDQQHLLRVD